MFRVQTYRYRYVENSNKKSTISKTSCLLQIKMTDCDVVNTLEYTNMYEDYNIVARV